VLARAGGSFFLSTPMAEADVDEAVRAVQSALEEVTAQ
jgi:hypothetical protein